MTWPILSQIILFGIALSMDAFAVSIISGLTMQGLNRKRNFFIAGTFGFLQGFMPLLGFLSLELIEVLVDSTGGSRASEFMTTSVTWIAFALLLLIGGKMLFEAIHGLISPPEHPEEKQFSLKAVFLLGIATSIDALATGIAFHNVDAKGQVMSTMSTIWLHVAIIMVITFAFSLIGLLLGKQIIKLLKGRYEIAGIIGGVILLFLAAWIVVSHYVGL
ncbi:MAG: manganese efflux pump [Bacilli bacterium]|nr:manganese efflux pump [Bacilli bacterium]